MHFLPMLARPIQKRVRFRDKKKKNNNNNININDMKNETFNFNTAIDLKKKLHESIRMYICV